MARVIKIDPVTRIEGHAKITILLADDGSVEDARFHVTQFRGFEKLVQGRPLAEMPSIMARICGICPVSHLMASAKACDDLLAVEIPEVAVRLRRIMNHAQFVQSHALSFFHLSSPDLLLGMDADPKSRNIFALASSHPEQAKAGIALRRFGQQIIERLGGKRIHPAWAVPGGVNSPLDPTHRDAILAEIPQSLQLARQSLDWFKQLVDQFTDEIETFANYKSMFLSLVAADKKFDNYDGVLTFIDSEGNIVAEEPNHRRYQDHIAEAVEEWTYLKFPYYKPMGYPNGHYRVGPIARLAIADTFRTPEADKELSEYRSRLGRTPTSMFYNHWARLIEIVHGIEAIAQLLDDPSILDKFVRARAEANRLEGVGVSEAPRGTLTHHYQIDENGLMKSVNLIIATGHNNLAMNHGVKQVAQRFLDGNAIQEGMLNRIEAVIRTFDPCLSCSTHALGQMKLLVEFRDKAGNLVDRLQRD